MRISISDHLGRCMRRPAMLNRRSWPNGFAPPLGQAAEDDGLCCKEPTLGRTTTQACNAVQGWDVRHTQHSTRKLKKVSAEIIVSGVNIFHEVVHSSRMPKITETERREPSERARPHCHTAACSSACHHAATRMFVSGFSSKVN